MRLCLHHLHPRSRYIKTSLSKMTMIIMVMTIMTMMIMMKRTRMIFLTSVLISAGRLFTSSSSGNLRSRFSS